MFASVAAVSSAPGVHGSGSGTNTRQEPLPMPPRHHAATSATRLPHRLSNPTITWIIVQGVPVQHRTPRAIPINQDAPSRATGRANTHSTDPTNAATGRTVVYPAVRPCPVQVTGQDSYGPCVPAGVALPGVTTRDVTLATQHNARNAATTARMIHRARLDLRFGDVMTSVSPNRRPTARSGCRR